MDSIYYAVFILASILYQLKPPPKSIQTLDTYNVHLFGLVTNSFRFHCVKLWEYYQEILTGKKEYLGLVPLLLELSPQPDEELLARQRQIIQQEKNAERKTELTGLCLALASRYFSFEFLKNFYEEDLPMIESLEDVPYIGEKIRKARSDGLKEGLLEGMKEGMQQGVQHGIRSSIFELLKDRFDQLDGIEEIIDSITDIDELQRIFKLALKIESLEAFKEAALKIRKG